MAQTTQERLEQIVKSYADISYTYWLNAFDMLDEDERLDGLDAFTHEDIYDVRFMTNINKDYLWCEIMMAGGGPTVWISTGDHMVHGSWGGDKFSYPISLVVSELIDEFYSEFYSAS